MFDVESPPFFFLIEPHDLIHTQIHFRGHCPHAVAPERERVFVQWEDVPFWAPFMKSKVALTHSTSPTFPCHFNNVVQQ